MQSLLFSTNRSELWRKFVGQKIFIKLLAKQDLQQTASQIFGHIGGPLTAPSILSLFRIRDAVTLVFDQSL